MPEILGRGGLSEKKLRQIWIAARTAGAPSKAMDESKFTEAVRFVGVAGVDLLALQTMTLSI